MYVVCSQYSFTPQAVLPLTVIQHGSNTLHQRPVQPFCSTILLRSVWCCCLMAYAVAGEELLQLSVYILTTSVAAYRLDLLA